MTAVREGAERHGMVMPKLFVEPGRSIAGKAAVTAYTVGTVKVIPGVRTYVAVDGGMSDNLRPMLYDSRYEAMLANKAEAPATDVVTVAGKHCESGDVLVRDVHIAPPQPGRHPRDAGDRRLRLRHGQQLQRAAAAGRGDGGRRPCARDHRTRDLGRRAAPAAPAGVAPPPTAEDLTVDKVGIGLLGYGTVGSGVGKLLTRNADDITLATGKQVYLRRVLEKDPGFSAPGLDPALVTTRFEDILEDPEIGDRGGAHRRGRARRATSSSAPSRPARTS